MPEITKKEDDRRVMVTLPDMYQSFLVKEPVLNRHYKSVRPESEEWLRSIMGLTPKQHRRVNICDFSYFCAVLVPHCPRDKLRVVSDWGNWVFLFDDMFDEGELTEDPIGSEKIINNLLNIMRPDTPHSSHQQPTVVTAHDDIFRRLASGSARTRRKSSNTSPVHVSRSGGLLGRYIQAMESYCAGALKHVQDHVTDKVVSVEEMIETRRMSIGVFPMYPLVEFAYSLNLPDEVFEHPIVRTLEDLGAEFVMLMNDILSYRKEESENCPFNMVAVCRMNGSSAQEAFDEIAAMVDSRFALWEEAVRSLPSWGGSVDRQVRLYIQGIQNIVQANLSWSFRSGRYFGSKGDQVLNLRKIDVLMNPSFLEHAPPPQAVKA
ncbi:terpene synthase metal binding domain-containing protein [Poronia punctata]|nr:terpene synthase metal binding domain-containing protein [Poronia punctata]